MPLNTVQSLKYKWNHKKVLEYKVVNRMKSLDNWEISQANGKGNVAKFSLPCEKVFEGKTYLKFVSYTKYIGTVGKAKFGEYVFLTRKFNEEDFSDYNC
jgi:hypothetical protein